MYRLSMPVMFSNGFPMLEEEAMAKYLFHTNSARFGFRCKKDKHKPVLKSSISEILSSSNFGLGPNPNGDCPLLPEG